MSFVLRNRPEVTTMLKEKLFILLTSIFGGKTAIAYVVVGLFSRNVTVLSMQVWD